MIFFFHLAELFYTKNHSTVHGFHVESDSGVDGFKSVQFYVGNLRADDFDFESHRNRPQGAYYSKQQEFFSQEGQDKFVVDVLRNQISGFFIDLAASHPFHFSNTCALERRGWHGLCIDGESSFMVGHVMRNCTPIVGNSQQNVKFYTNHEMGNRVTKEGERQGEEGFSNGYHYQVRAQVSMRAILKKFASSMVSRCRGT